MNEDKKFAAHLCSLTYDNGCAAAHLGPLAAQLGHAGVNEVLNMLRQLQCLYMVME